MSNLIKCKIVVYKSSYETYQKKYAEYLKEQDKAENLGIPCDMPEPKPTEKTELVDSVLFANKLKDNNFTHYLIHCHNKSTLTLCFGDGSVTVVEDSEEIRNTLNKLYD